MVSKNTKRESLLLLKGFRKIFKNEGQRTSWYYQGVFLEGVKKTTITTQDSQYLE
jgi:rhamnogalacturonyl hydrolase YesR